jgi:hypothetical protein
MCVRSAKLSEAQGSRRRLLERFLGRSVSRASSSQVVRSLHGVNLTITGVTDRGSCGLQEHSGQPAHAPGPSGRRRITYGGKDIEEYDLVEWRKTAIAP